MDIRTKLVFALVAASLVGMFALGGMAYTTASRLLRAEALGQLDALAESKKEGLEQVVAGWSDGVHLIASRTQLRQSLREYNLTRSPESQSRIGRILQDALGSVGAIESLTVYDQDGFPAASARLRPELAVEDLTPSSIPDPADAVVYEGISFGSDDRPHVGLVSPLVLEEERIGALHVLLYARELIDLIQNFRGLGETGETMIVLRDRRGSVHVMHPTRGPAAERSEPLTELRGDDPASRAMRGEEGTFSQGIIDYRQRPVWAATRYLPETGWGLVVKFDAGEERAPVIEFRRQLTALALSLSAFAILVGTLLGLRFAKPIRDLSEVANRIRLGDLQARAKVVSEDEVGFLASTFNQMAQELERRMSLLREFQKFFDVSLDMLCIAGTDGYFKRVNPAFERTLGWREDELVSQPFTSFVHPDDVEATLREVEKLSQGIPTVSFENRYRCRDGSYKRLLWTSQPEPETGRLYAVARDISELELGNSR